MLTCEGHVTLSLRISLGVWKEDLKMWGGKVETDSIHCVLKCMQSTYSHVPSGAPSTVDTLVNE